MMPPSAGVSVTAPGLCPGGIGDEPADVDVAITAVVEDRVDGAVARNGDSRQVSKVTAGDQDWRCPRVFSGIESLQHQVVVAAVEETVDNHGPAARIGGEVDQAATSVATFTHVERLRRAPPAGGVQRAGAPFDADGAFHLLSGRAAVDRPDDDEAVAVGDEMGPARIDIRRLAIVDQRRFGPLTFDEITREEIGVGRQHGACFRRHESLVPPDDVEAIMSIDGEGRQHLVSGVRVGRHWNGVCPGAIHQSLIDELTPSIGAVTRAIRVNEVDDSLAIGRGGCAELSSAGAHAACRAARLLARDRNGKRTGGDRCCPPRCESAR